MEYTFFAMLARLKFINRWVLMRNTREENLAEHSLEVAMLSHALCLIGNKTWNKKLNAERAALIGLFHDATEILTGDMPTPVKYLNPVIKEAYKEIEKEAAEKLIEKLPPEMREEYRGILLPGKEELIYERKLVKAADKLSAYLKCLEEKKTGNAEFRKAEEATLESLHSMGLQEVEHFLNTFVSAYGKTLDEL